MKAVTVTITFSLAELRALDRLAMNGAGGGAVDDEVMKAVLATAPERAAGIRALNKIAVLLSQSAAYSERGKESK